MQSGPNTPFTPFTPKPLNMTAISQRSTSSLSPSTSNIPIPQLSFPRDTAKPGSFGSEHDKSLNIKISNELQLDHSTENVPKHQTQSVMVDPVHVQQALNRIHSNTDNQSNGTKSTNQNVKLLINPLYNRLHCIFS